jgi:hypothetical protein
MTATNPADHDILQSAMLAEVHEINAEFSPLQGVVKFKNNDQHHFMIAANKAKSHAKGFRQAAAMISGDTEQAKNMREWLTDLAGKFDRCEGE